MRKWFQTVWFIGPSPLGGVMVVSILLKERIKLSSFFPLSHQSEMLFSVCVINLNPSGHSGAEIET